MKYRRGRRGYDITKFRRDSEVLLGFCKGKSTIDAFDELVREFYNMLEKKGFAWVTYCDSSKALVCVDYDVLLIKLLLYLQHQWLLTTIIKVLPIDRIQKVIIGKICFKKLL